MINIDKVMSYHLAWKGRLRGFLQGQEDMTEAEIGSYEQCELGHWLYSEGIASLGSISGITELEKSHRELHELALGIIRMTHPEKRISARKELLTLDTISLRVFSLLISVQKALNDMHDMQEG